MSTLVFTLLVIATGLALAYSGQRLRNWAIATAALLALGQALMTGFALWPWLVAAAIFVPFLHPGLRRDVISARLLKWMRSVLPSMSDTEREALEAGTVWWDKDLFSGRPDWERLLAYPKPKISQAEQDFLDGPVEELCKMVDEWKVSHELNDLPPEVWDFIKRNRFFGMIIPEEYGGLDFSARAQTEVVMKLSTRSAAAAVTVMVPNSLGPGELLLHYGTEAQRNHYLPRLAVGEEIPAFALTGPYAGSDAGGMPDAGIVCMGEYQGKQVLGFRANWDKRYITLGPVCTVLGLAFKAYDPDGLLGGEEDLGITCALIPRETPGVEIGNRHYPGAAFMNGPNRGKDVFIPMEWVIGGQPMVGQGWRMLMDCLSVGRAISLPALGAAAGKAAARLTGAYARVRRQFKIPIGKFEGVEEALARIGGICYRMDASRVLTAGALDLGEKPGVLSAILKYHNTEGMRTVINDAMDVHGGSGICMGPRNYLSSTYRAVPIAITVEGANILTRTMIIFGQGAIRCHPFVLKEMLAAQADPTPESLAAFDEAFFGHVGFTIRNAVRSLVLGLTGARFAGAPDVGAGKRYLRQLTRMSSAFAFIADVSMLTLGGRMKRKEKISGRLGDALSHLYMASAVVKLHEENGRPAADLPLVEWALQDSLYHIQEALEGVIGNFPVRPVGWLMKALVTPLGRPYKRPKDRLGQSVAKLLLSPSATRDRLTSGMFISADPDDAMGMLEVALSKVIASEPLERKVYGAIHKRVRPYNYRMVLDEAIAKEALSVDEANTIAEAAELITAVIAVDEFAPRESGFELQPVDVDSPDQAIEMARTG